MPTPIRSILLAVMLGLGLAPPVLARTGHGNKQVLHVILRSQNTVRPAVVPRTSSPKKHHHHRKTPAKPAPVKLRISAGYNGLYRDSTWVPVRVTAHNRTSSTISGTLETPDTSTSGGSSGPPQSFRALYQTSIILPGGATKTVTLYLPSPAINGEVDVHMVVGSTTVAAATVYPATYDGSSMSIGALTSDPASVTWLKRLKLLSGIGSSVARLTPATFDALPEALANFDTIVVNDGSVSALDHAQMTTLETYVRNGGTLVMVGGPGWQEALRPLPADLVPGHAGRVAHPPKSTWIAASRKGERSAAGARGNRQRPA